MFAAYAALAREQGASASVARDNDAAPARGGEAPARDASAWVARDNDAALALYVWTWLGELFANAALWQRPRVAVAGGLAMGAFAVPALWRR